MGDDDMMHPELITDTKKSITKNDKGELVYYFKKIDGTKIKTKVNKFRNSSFVIIIKILSKLKRSTFKSDKVAIKPITEIFIQKRRLESMNNTDKVLDTPKRVTMFVFSRKTQLTYEGIKTINSLSYLREILEKLSELESRNVLEAEASDLVQLRIEEKEKEKEQHERVEKERK